MNHILAMKNGSQVSVSMPRPFAWDIVPWHNLQGSRQRATFSIMYLLSTGCMPMFSVAHMTPSSSLKAKFSMGELESLTFLLPSHC